MAHCRECPRLCGAKRDEGERGLCGETRQVRAALACIHYGEEPPITVHGGSGTLFFTGCTLNCAFCQNFQISQMGMGGSISLKKFVEICKKLEEEGAENINLVTPSHFIRELSSYIKAAKYEGVSIPFCWNSSAYEKTEMLELLKGLVTVWLPDLKTLSSSLSSSLFRVKNYPESAKRAIKWMIENNPLDLREVKAEKTYTDANGVTVKKGEVKEKMFSGVIVRHLFLPGHFEETVKVLEWLKENADEKALISLMNQYTPVDFSLPSESGRKGVMSESCRKAALSAIENRTVTKREDKKLRDIVKEADFNYLFYQELTSDTSWLPDFSRARPFSNRLSRTVWHFMGKNAK